VKVVCRECGETIAVLVADTRRKEIKQDKEAVCEDCAISEEDVLEELSDLEHRQWMHWSKYVAENHDIPEELREKWEKNWKPYSDLSEDMKEKDRKWAKKALAVFKETSDGGDME